MKKWKLLFGVVWVGFVLSPLLPVLFPGDDHEPSPLVGPIIEGLRTTPVYVAPGAPPVIDAARARQVIGDRPIVVAALDRTLLPADNNSEKGVREQLCEDVAAATPTNLVMVFAMDGNKYGGYTYDATVCAGPEFSNPDHPVDAEAFTLDYYSAKDSSFYRANDTNMTPLIEEYVLQFDAQAAKSYPEFVPRRAPVVPLPPAPSAVQTWQVVLAMAVVFVVGVMVFALLRLFVRLHQRRQSARAEADSETVAMSARLNSLADSVLRPGKPRDAEDAAHQAEVARRYVLALLQFEQEGPTARTQTQVGELEELVKT